MRRSTGNARHQAEGQPDVLSDVIHLVADTLGLDPSSLDADTQLLGHMIELDSMAVVAIIMELESMYGFVVGDDELSSSVFSSVANLVGFVVDKRQQ